MLKTDTHSTVIAFHMENKLQIKLQYHMNTLLLVWNRDRPLQLNRSKVRKKKLREKRGANYKQCGQKVSELRENGGDVMGEFSGEGLKAIH